MISKEASYVMIVLVVFAPALAEQQQQLCEIRNGNANTVQEQLDEVSRRICTQTNINEESSKKVSKQVKKLTEKLDDAMHKIENFEYLLGKMAETLAKGREEGRTATKATHGPTQKGSTRAAIVTSTTPTTTIGLSEQKRRERVIQRMADNGVCGVYHFGNCFWYTNRKSVATWQHAISVCKSRGGTPANIYDMEHYNKTLKYIQSRLDGSADLWLGMKIDTETEEVFYYDGSKANFQKWAKGFPETWIKDEDRSRIVLIVDTSADDTGMVNSNTGYRSDVRTLCEVNVPL